MSFQLGFAAVLFVSLPLRTLSQITHSGGGELNCVTNNCQSTTITFTSNQAFSMNCNADDSCRNSQITVQSGCSLSGTIDCDDDDACRGTTLSVYDSDLSGSQVDCDSGESYNSCKDMTINLYGTSRLVLNCGDDNPWEACFGLVINAYDTSRFIAAAESDGTPYTLRIYDQATYSTSGHSFTVVTQDPTKHPTQHPSVPPTRHPTDHPSVPPTRSTPAPTGITPGPTRSTAEPTSSSPAPTSETPSPTGPPTPNPTPLPTKNPTAFPIPMTVEPSEPPTYSPIPDIEETTEEAEALTTKGEEENIQNKRGNSGLFQINLVLLMGIVIGALCCIVAALLLFQCVFLKTFLSRMPSKDDKKALDSQMKAHADLIRMKSMSSVELSEDGDADTFQRSTVEPNGENDDDYQPGRNTVFIPNLPDSFLSSIPGENKNKNSMNEISGEIDVEIPASMKDLGSPGINSDDDEEKFSDDGNEGMTVGRFAAATAAASSVASSVVGDDDEDDELMYGTGTTKKGPTRGTKKTGRRPPPPPPASRITVV